MVFSSSCYRLCIPLLGVFMEKEMKQGTCIIIGAGDLTVGTIPYNTETDFVIAADGGLMYCGILEIEPDLVIGDFDSVDDEYRTAVEIISEACPEKVVTLPVEKDDTDMLAAVKTGLSLGYKQFRLYAANGGRLEHTIANIQVLKYLKTQGATGYIMDGTGMMLLAQNETIAFKETMEGYVNVFSMNEKAHGVAIRGLKYELEHATLSNDLPVGISNEFVGKKAEISVEDGTLLVIVNWV